MGDAAIADVPKWVARWVGLPFEDRGRGPAYDCWGLARAVVAERTGVVLPTHDEYETTRDHDRLGEVVVGARGGFDQVLEPVEGDLVLFRIQGRPCHVGVVVAPPWFLHAWGGHTSALERWDAMRWANRVEGFYRWTR